jgi:predicted transposase/invertase (TIGR01784 family)
MTLEEKIEMGRRKGREERQCEMIRNMIKEGLSVEMIASIAGLTVGELHAFAQEHGIKLE